MTWDDLTRAGIDPSQLDIADSAAMTTFPDLIATGKVDVAQVLEPVADTAIAEGRAHICFADRGDIGYTSFYTTRTYLRNRKPADRCSALHARSKRWQRSRATTSPPNFPTCSRMCPRRSLPPQSADIVLEPLAAAERLSIAAFVRLKSALLAGG